MNDATQLTPDVGPEDHARGPADAPVTVVEYGDYECPYCGMAHPIVQGLQRRFGDQLRFVYRNFPLKEAHPHAQHAAEAAEAVGAEGGEERFWAMHDLLFEHQDALEDEDLLRYAESLGVPAEEIAQRLAEGTYAKRVRGDFRNGVRSGVNGTPSFFINGRRYDGPWADPEKFAAAIQHAADTGAGHPVER